jgi:hypothetical protein
MLNYLLNKQSNIKAFIPFINKFNHLSKFYFNENNKTYNKLVGIAMQKEKNNLNNTNQIINHEFSRNNYAEEQTNNSYNNFYNRN